MAALEELKLGLPSEGRVPGTEAQASQGDCHFPGTGEVVYRTPDRRIEFVRLSRAGLKRIDVVEVAAMYVRNRPFAASCLAVQQTEKPSRTATANTT